MSDFHKATTMDEVPEGGARRVVIEGRPIGIYQLDGEYFAIDDTCTHAEASLCDGVVDDGEVACPLHFATFDIRSGECTGPPADENVTRHEVRVSGNDIEVRLADE